MRNLGLLKKLVVVVLSIGLVMSLATVVRAANETNSYSEWDTPVRATGTTNANANANETTTNGTDFTNAIVDTNTTTNTNTTTTNTNTNTNTNVNTNNTTVTTLNTNTANTRDNTNVNSLAYTGIESNSVLPIVVVLGVIVAVYSFKKIKEYNV